MSMVHFDFTVSAVDAENIMQIMSDAVTKQDMHIASAIAANKPDEARWYRLHKSYLLELIRRMTTHYHV